MTDITLKREQNIRMCALKCATSHASRSMYPSDLRNVLQAFEKYITEGELWDDEAEMKEP